MFQHCSVLPRFVAFLPFMALSGLLVGACADDEASEADTDSASATSTGSTDTGDTSGTGETGDTLSEACGKGLFVGDYTIRGALALESLSGYTGITGDLVIAGSEVTSLAGLECLEELGGSLYIEATGLSSLTSESFGALQALPGDLVIRYNQVLVNVALDSINLMGGSVLVTDNPALTTLSLPELSSIAGSIFVGQYYEHGVLSGGLNSALTFVDLSALIESGGSLQLTLGPSGASLILPALSSVGGVLAVSQCGALEALDLPSLTSVSDRVSVSSNSALTRFDLGSLVFIGDDLAFNDNPALSICAIEALRDQLIAAGWTGQLDAWGNLAESCGEDTGDTETQSDSQTTDTGTEPSTETADTDSGSGSDLDTGEPDTETGDTSTVPCDKGVFMGNYTIMTQMAIDALAGYTGITGNLEIRGPQITSLSGLACLTQLGGSLTVSETSLKSLGRFQLGGVTSIPGDVTLINNSELQRIEFGSLTEIGGQLFIYSDGHNVLQSLDLASLSRVGGSLQLSFQRILPSLALPSLVEIGGERLEIDSNESLESLELGQLRAIGIDRFGSNVGEFRILSNLSLPMCEAFELLDQLVAAGWTGSSAVYDGLEDECSYGYEWP